MLDVKCTEHLNKVREAAERMGRGATESLEEKLAYLAGYANGDGQSCDKSGTRCELHKDFAPLSFEFAMYRGDGIGGWDHWFNGGLIYHGPDVPGDGSFPSLSVDTSDSTAPRWSVHT